MWHYKTIEEIYEDLNSSPNGLTTLEAIRRLKIYGENRLKEEKENILNKILNILKNYFLWLFFISFGLSLIIKQYVDGTLIGIFIILYILFDLIDDMKTEKIIKSLEEKLSTYVNVIRDNKIIKINSKQLVPGDIILLYRGDKVPADIRIIEAENLYVDESMITGESEPIRKFDKVLDKDTDIFHMSNMLFAGSYIIDGYCKGIVVETGNNTYIGRINKKIKNKRKESILEKDIEKFGKYISIFTFIIVLITFLLVYIFKYFNLYNAILFSISLAILIVPEGLPSALLIILYYGVDRLKKKGILIKNPNVLESFGYINIIVSDKTGTLTYNEYQVSYIYFNDKLYNRYEIDNRLDPILEALYNNINHDDRLDNSIYKFLVNINYKKGYKKIKFIPFDENRGFSISIVNKNGKVIEYIKGIPEKLLSYSNYIYINDRLEDINEYKDKIINFINEYSEKGYRIIGVGYKDSNNIIFLGLILLENKLRENIIEYINFLKENNIDLIIVSGDHPKNVEFIGKKLNISDKALIGSEIKKMSDEELYRNIIKYKLVARVDPEDKLRIIKVLKKYKNNVVMIGDGINDILSMKGSDISITFKDSVDAAKEVADVVLLNSSLSNVVEIIKEGKKDLYLTRIYIIVVLSVLFGILFNILISFFVYKTIFLGAISLLILNLVIETINSLVVVDGEVKDNNNKIYKYIWKTIIDRNLTYRIIRNGIFIGLDSLILAFATFGSIFTIILFYILITYILFLYYGNKYGVYYERNKSFYISLMFSVFILLVFTIMPYSNQINLRFPPFIDYIILIMVIILFIGTKYILYLSEKNTV